MDSRKHFTQLRLAVRVLGPWMLAATESHALSPPAGASACGELVTAEVAAGIARFVGGGSY